MCAPVIWYLAFGKEHLRRRCLWSVTRAPGQPPRSAGLPLCSYLRVGGVAFLQIPTLYGVQQGRKFHRYWALLDLPRHLSFFGRDGLSGLCEKAGMKLIVFKTPLLETAWCYYASVSNYANHFLFSRATNRRRAIAGAAVPFLSLPLIWLCGHGGATGRSARAVAVKR